MFTAPALHVIVALAAVVAICKNGPAIASPGEFAQAGAGTAAGALGATAQGQTNLRDGGRDTRREVRAEKQKLGGKKFSSLQVTSSRGSDEADSLGISILFQP